MPERDYHRDNKSFLIYKDWKTAVDLLSNEQAGELFKALFAFAVNGESTQTNDAAFDALLNIMFQQIERDGEKFEAVCQKRSENGKKGGRPKKQTDNNKSKKSKRFFEKAKKADTETDTDIDTDIESVSATPKKSAPVRHKYGEYKNVLLSDEEADKLRADLPNGQFERYIESLSGHIASKGASYKSHYATIRNWYKRDQEKSAAPPQSKLQTGRYDNSNASYDLDEWEKYAKDFDPGAETM
ncbi:MAG: hypothetical protein IKO27_06700 [Ruminococcus sp.]|nr:hypothetical protein [Ruminococcus sp.]